jgi:hypothetical protein
MTALGVNSVLNDKLIIDWSVGFIYVSAVPKKKINTYSNHLILID